MAKTAVDSKKTSKLDVNLSMELAKCYIWSIAVYGAANWAFRKVDQKYLGSCEMWCWRRMEKVSWTDGGKNEVKYMVKEEINILHTRIDQIWRKNCLLKRVIERKTGERQKWREYEEKDVSS